MTWRPNRVLLVVSFCILYLCVAIHALAWMEMMRPARPILGNWKLNRVGGMQILFLRETLLSGSMKADQLPPSFTGWSNNLFIVRHRVRFSPLESTAYRWRRWREEELAVQLWPLTLLAVIYPIHCSRIENRRRKRRGSNHCSDCNYDLTGNRSGLCPECGTALGAGK